MQCPNCKQELTTTALGTLELDVCSQGCGGIWFDEGELKKVDENSEFPNETLLLQKGVSSKPGAGQQKQCPRCTDEVLVRQFADIKNQVELDQCWKCSGVWLDIGELQTIRSQYATAADRSKAIDAYVSSHIEDVSSLLARKTKEDIARYEKHTAGRFSSALYLFKKVLGRDPEPGDGL